MAIAFPTYENIVPWVQEKDDIVVIAWRHHSGGGLYGLPAIRKIKEQFKRGSLYCRAL